MEYYEDVAVGDTREFGEYHVTEDEIVAFAEQYDPQSFHTDPEAAAGSHFGGLVASGWHTTSMCMRMLVDGPLQARATMGARGVDDLRWRRPVRPGDTLHLRTEVVDKRPSPSAPGRGQVDTRIEGLRDDGEVVVSWIALELVARRGDD